MIGGDNLFAEGWLYCAPLRHGMAPEMQWSPATIKQQKSSDSLLRQLVPLGYRPSSLVG